MKHNLPQPSQAWGSDINRRIAYLENDMTLMKSKVSNSYDAVTALNASRASNGVAQPFYEEHLIMQPGSHDGISGYENLWQTHLDWGNAGSFMQLSIAGYLYIPVRDFDLSEYVQPQVSIGVRDNQNNERRLDSYVTSIVERVNNSTRYALSSGLSFTMVVDFDRFQHGLVFVGIQGMSGAPKYINNKDSHAHLFIQFSGVRY